MTLLLGIDIGTSATKAVVMDERGTIVASASREYPLYSLHAGWSEQDPEDWWAATCAAIKDLLATPGVAPNDIAGVSFSGQMHGSVLLGRDAPEAPGRADVIRRALLWNDQRTVSQCARIEQVLGGRRNTVRLVGNAALPGFTLPKLLWVREHEPEVWSNVHHVLLPKDFIRYRLTGSLGTDVGDASGTLLFDVDHRDWSREAISRFDLRPDLFPPATESAQLIGTVSRWASVQTGLPEGIRVVAGTGDNMAGAVGAGVVEERLILAVLGTSGVVLAHSGTPRKDLDVPQECGRLHTMCAGSGGPTRCDGRDSQGWCITGCTLSAGGALQWARNTLAPGLAYEQLMQEAATAPPGCEGLVFLPYLTGERCPHPDPAARGGFIGLTSRHTRAHLFRAVIEGVTFNMTAILDIMRSIGVAVQTVRLSGGGNRSQFWRQMQADCYNAPVVTTNSDEGGSALGAALLAGVGVGVWPTVAEACRATIQVRETLEASKERGLYDRPRAIFAGLYHDLASRFVELAGVGAARLDS
jgi:xylulokinase